MWFSVRLALGVPAPRLDADRLLHLLPHLVGDDAVASSRGTLHHELLERPHRHLREVAELAVDRPDEEAELGEPLLDVCEPRSPAMP